MAVWAGIWLAAAAVFPGIYREHGPMENFQAGTLAGCCVLCFSLGISKTHLSGLRILSAGLALFFLIFFLLEFDTRLLDAPLLRRVTNGAVRNAWLGLLVIGYGVLLARAFNIFWVALIDWLSQRSGMLFVASGFFWIAGFIVDKLHPIADSSAALLLEELMEMEATLLMGICAVLTRFYWARRQRLKA